LEVLLGSIRQYKGIVLVTAPLVVTLQIGLHYLLFMMGMPSTIKYVHFNLISLVVACVIGTREGSVLAALVFLTGVFLTQVLLVAAFWIYMAAFIGGA
jgi:hypothetical protein